jgi:DNA-binding MarR family transcriptional regulator
LKTEDSGILSVVPDRRPLPPDPIEEARRQWDERWPGGATMAAATSIMRAQQIVQAAVDEALRPFGLTFARYEALVLLAFSKRGALPMGKMGERLMIHPTSVTNIVDRLEGQGFVRRRPHERDRRTTLAEITDAGRVVMERATGEVVACAFGLDALSETQLDQVTALVRAVRVASGEVLE